MRERLIRPNKCGIFPKLDGESMIFQLALGNVTQYRVGLIPTPRGVFIAIEGHGAYEFSQYAHHDYVMEKLGLAPFDGDAQNLADFINDQVEPDSERQGTYRQHLCSDGEL